MASRSDVERALLYALLEPPPFEGDLDDPWFSAGPTPEPAIVERLRGLADARTGSVRSALSRLREAGLARQVPRGEVDDPLPRVDYWELTDRGAAEADRLPGEFVSTLRSREDDRVDGDNDEWLTHFYMSYLR